MISIRRLLTRRLLLTTFGLLALGLITFLMVACYAVVRQFDVALRTKALAVSTVALVTADSVKVEFSDRFLQGFDEERPRDFYELWLPDGAILGRSESLGTADLPHEIGSYEKPRYFLCTLPTGRPGRGLGFVFKPKQAPGINRPMEIQIVVASDREDLDHTLLQFVGLAASCAILLVGATLWFVPRLLRVGLKPLEVLGKQAERIHAASLAERFPISSLPEELQPIGTSLNGLLARLELSFERERRFSADLAHELRTPIAELRTLAECSIKWPETRDATTDIEVLAIAKHMEGLATRMLALARGRSESIGDSHEVLALSPLLEEIWKPFAARAAARQLKVDFSIAPLSARADPVLLRSIIANLFDNAVDYAPEGGSIRVHLEQGPQAVILSVANVANSLNEADIVNLFDPFWRKNAARTTGQHFGLGLSLARTFAISMHWSLTATLDRRKQLVFQLSSAPNAQSRAPAPSNADEFSLEPSQLTGP